MTIQDAFVYQRNYVNNIEFNNIFITKYFKKIDKRRFDRGHHTLLPLKKVIVFRLNISLIIWKLLHKSNVLLQ